MIAAETIYRRVSSEEQGKNYSLPSQRDHCLDLARTRGCDAAAVADYCETVSAETLDDRPVALGLLREIAAGSIRTLIVWKLDRLARNMFDGARFLDACDRAGCTVISVIEGPVEFTPTGKMMAMFHMFGAETELIGIKLRLNDGKRRRIESGKLPVMNRPRWGYRHAGEKRERYEIDESIAPLVRLIFAEYASGLSLRGVVARLNADSIPTPSGRGKWEQTKVRSILTDETYMGRFYADRQRRIKEGGKARSIARPREEWTLIPGVAPAIVDADTFERVQRRLKDNRQLRAKPTKSDYAFLLRAGFVRCGYCGAKLSVDADREAYYCGRAKRTDECAGRFHRHKARALDSHIWERIFNTLTHPDELQKAMEARRTERPDDRRIKAIDREIAGLATRRHTLTTRLARLEPDDPICDDYEGQLRTLAAQAQALRAESAALSARVAEWEADQHQIDRSLAAWGEYHKQWRKWENATTDERRGLLADWQVQVLAFHPKDADHPTTYEITAALRLHEKPPVIGVSDRAGARVIEILPAPEDALVISSLQGALDLIRGRTGPVQLPRWDKTGNLIDPGGVDEVLPPTTVTRRDGTTVATLGGFRHTDERGKTFEQHRIGANQWIMLGSTT